MHILIKPRFFDWWQMFHCVNTASFVSAKPHFEKVIVLIFAHIQKPDDILFRKA